MVQLFSQSGQQVYGMKKYVLDTQTDLQSLPTNIPMGCTAFVISTSKHYMLNSDKEWIEFADTNGDGQSGGDSDTYGSIPFSEIDSYFEL